MEPILEQIRWNCKLNTKRGEWERWTLEKESDYIYIDLELS